jgi:hypothetical protein
MAETTQTTETADAPENPNIKSNYYIECKLNESEVPSKCIQKLIIREWVFDEQRIPRLELTFHDDGHFTDADIPYQGKKLSLVLARDISEQDHENGAYITAEFIVIDFQYMKSLYDQMASNSTIQVTAILNITDPFENIPDKCYENKTSNEVAEEISGIIATGFFANAAGQDRMNWITRSNSPFQMIAHIVDRAYFGPDDAAFCYLDIHSMLNFMSLKTAITDTYTIPAKLDEDLCIINNKMQLIKAASTKDIDENTALNTLWYCNLDVKNIAGSEYLRSGGYGYAVRWVDFEDGSFGFSNSTSSANTLAVASRIISNYYTFLETSDDPSLEAPKSIDNNDFLGVLKKGTADNVYGKDYFFMKQLRQNIITLLLSQSVLIEVNPIVPVELMALIDLQIPSNIPTEERNYNEVIGGKYIVMGINYIIDNGFYKKYLSLHRVGWNSCNLLRENA